MTALELALAFVFISNAIFLVAAGGVLIRILHHTRTAHEALVHAAEETRAAGKQLQHVAHESHEQLQRHAAAGAGASTSDAAVERLTQMVRDMLRAQEGAPGAGEDGAAPEDAARDRSVRRELDRALAHNHRLQSTLAQLRLQLEEANKTVTEMRREHKMAANEALDNMRQLVSKLHGQLEQARRGARDSERRAKALELELGRIRQDIEESQSPGELGDLERRLDEMQRENGELSGEVQGLKDLIQRTLREKHFIEDRFVEMDQALRAPPAPAARPEAPELVTPQAAGHGAASV